MSAVLISPNLLVQRNDRFTTGVVYMPIGLAYVSAYLKSKNIQTCLIDAFAENPEQHRIKDQYLVLGLAPEDVYEKIPQDVSLVFIYANQVINHDSIVAIISILKERLPSIPVFILENTQAVTAYALKPVSDLLFKAGADYIVEGQAEAKCAEISRLIADGRIGDVTQIEGVYSRNDDINNIDISQRRIVVTDINELPFPDWDAFPLEKYWGLGFSHGPLSENKYLPILTSRGCPYPCKFCVVPSTNNRKWKGRDYRNVVDEMAFFVDKYGVTEFHVEDLNPTINDKRIQQICEEIIDRGLKIKWKISAGTKIESIKSEQTIKLMAKAGCNYISISPESGSAKVLKLIKKPFDLEHAKKLVKHMNEQGIYSQACFVLGFPGEDANDRKLTAQMVKDLTKNGVDEIALFIVSPVPGSEIYHSLKGFSSLSELNFTPTWREDYKELSKFRLSLYCKFLLWKCLYHPGKIIKQGINFLRGRYNTKMEMVPFKAWYYKRLESK